MARFAPVLLAIVSMSACDPPREPHERLVRTLFDEALRDEDAFAVHFAPEVPLDDIRELRAKMSTDLGAPVDIQDGPACVRVSWSRRAYVIFLHAIPEGFEITDVVHDDPTPGSWWIGTEHHEHRAIAHERCVVANAEATIGG